MFTSTITLARSGTFRRAGGDSFVAAAWRWYRLRRDTRRLMTFNDHMLRDIGLGRGEIEQTVRTGRPSRGSTAP